MNSNQVSKMKICTDCKFFEAVSPSGRRAQCANPSMPINLVTGELMRTNCGDQRVSIEIARRHNLDDKAFFCGAEGRLFEKAPDPNQWAEIDEDDVCMPGSMIGVGGWVENTRDDIPDLVTCDGVEGRTEPEQRENARRIAACWNALAEFETDDIERSHFAIKGEA